MKNTENTNWEKEIYRIIDSFLVEAKNQDGNDRSLEQLNQDRHLAADNFVELFHVILSSFRASSHERQRLKKIVQTEIAKADKHEIAPLQRIMMKLLEEK